MQSCRIACNVLSLGLVADDQDQCQQKLLIIKFKNNMDKDKTIPTLSQTTVMPRYFKCRFFKGQILHSRILEAKDEVDIKNVFAKRYPIRHLLEAIEINEA